MEDEVFVHTRNLVRVLYCVRRLFPLHSLEATMTWRIVCGRQDQMQALEIIGEGIFGGGKKLTDLVSVCLS